MQERKDKQKERRDGGAMAWVTGEKLADSGGYGRIAKDGYPSRNLFETVRAIFRLDF
jgi:hypothetical protein